MNFHMNTLEIVLIFLYGPLFLWGYFVNKRLNKTIKGFESKLNKETEHRTFVRRQAITTLELTKGFTPEQRKSMGNLLITCEEMAGYVMELTSSDKD